MSVPSESRNLLQQNLFTARRAEKFANVNSEGKQLAVGGGESTRGGSWRSPFFLWEAHSRRAFLALLCSCWP